MKRWTGNCALAIALVSAAEVTAVTLVKGPYLQNLTTDGVTVMWETDEPAAGTVEYGLAGRLTRRASGKSGRKIQEVRLTGLQPETGYQYRVIAGETKSGPFGFQTAVKRDTPYRFAVYGDNRSHPDDHAAVVKAMAKHRPAFVINTGDLVGNGNVYEQWGPEFFAPLAGLCRHVPVYPTLGNHEGNGELYRQFFSLPDSEWYYAFKYGNAKFVMVDSCFRENNWFAPSSKQGRWLVGALKDRGHTWTFAAFHHPPYSSHPKRGHSVPHQKQLCPALEAHGVDVVFNGHNHYYERIYPMRALRRDDVRGVHYVITGGGGAPIYPARKEWFTAAHESAHHYCIVDVDGPWLTLTAYGVDGHVIDQFGLCKDPVRLAQLASGAKSASGAARAKAIGRLSIIFSPKVVELLAPFAADEELAVRRAVAAGLGRLAMSAGRATALKLLGDADAEVRRGAALAIARTSGPADGEVVMRLLRDPDVEVRRSATWFFVHVDPAKADRQALLTALADSDVVVRRRVVARIRAAKDEWIRPLLAKMLVDPDTEVALHAMDLTIAGGHGAALLAPLSKAARHKDARIRRFAIKSIVASKRREVILPVLIDAVGDEDPKVQGYVVGSLERLTKQRFGFDQTKWKRWWAEQPR